MTGKTVIPIGAQSLSIAFGATFTVAYQFEELEIENTSDLSPMILMPEITAYDANGFKVEFNGTPDTNNYFLIWKVVGTSTSIPPVPDLTTVLTTELDDPLETEVGELITI